MHSKWVRRLCAMGLLSSVAYSTVGCAERADIDRVQPMALNKAFFIGQKLSDPTDDPEFYMRNTVIDVPYGATQDGLFTATYAQPVNRIKWEITENFLIARLTYELIENADHHGSRRTNDGQIVASYKIISHFDVRNNYNPSTGEVGNVREENTSDRPWYEREQFRVDWSKNWITTAYHVDTLSMLGLYGGVEWESVAYDVTDPADPNRFVMAENDGYFDVTNKVFAKPTMVDTPWGMFPSCYFYGVYPAGNCNPSEATLRLSFKKVVDTDFEPSDWDGNRMEAFGVFYEERQGYERNYGLTDTRWHRFANKYNIWERSHISTNVGGKETFAQCGSDFWRDEDGQIMKFKFNGDEVARDGKGFPIPDANGKPLALTGIGEDANRGFMEEGTADECKPYGYEGARCDVHTNRCSLPMFERKLKTIPWYYGPDAPEDLFASTANATYQWDLAVRSAAQTGKKAEHDRLYLDGGLTTSYNDDGSTFEETWRERDIAREDAEGSPTVPHVFVLCHNPVVKGDDPACGAPGMRVRLGDIRYNTVNLINTPQMGSPWGIMVDGVDPLTGEKVSASINEWITVLDGAAQGAMDTIRWLNGEITDQDVVSGQYINEWLSATNKGLALSSTTTMTREDIDHALAAPAQLGMPGGPPMPAAAMKSQSAFRAWMKDRARYVTQQTGPAIDNQLEANRKRLIDSKFETMLVTPEQLQRVGLPADTLATQGSAQGSSAQAMASVLRGLSPELRHWRERQMSKAEAKNHFCMITQEDTEGYVSLARHAKALFPLPDPASENYAVEKHNRDQAIWMWLREQFHIAVIAHEMGHSVSLRHNFVSNFDPLNFHTQYWQLRTNNDKEKECEPENYSTPLGTIPVHRTPKADGTACVGPRWIDPVTEREIAGNLWKWGGTTVMDYPGDMSQETTGLGMYDRAAMRFVYGDVVDVDEDSKRSGSGSNADKYDTYLDKLDGFGGISGPLDFGGHYSSYQTRFKVLGDKLDESRFDDTGSGVLDAVYTGPKLLHRKIWDMQDVCINPQGGKSTPLKGQTCESYYVKNFAEDRNGYARRPYMFGSDEYADFGNVTVQRSDAGADVYEQMQFLINNYENRYIFTHFRKQNRLFNTGSVISRLEGRYMDKMQGTTKALGLYLGFLPPDYVPIYTYHPGLLFPHLLSSANSLDEYARIMTRPEPGYYYYAANNPRNKNCPNATTNNPGGPQVFPARQCDIPADFVVPAGSGEGRFIHNEYDYTKGYNWSDYQMQVGSYYEKVGAVYYLMEGYNHFLQNSKDDYIDGRSRNINYTTVYPEQMRKLYAYMMQDDRTEQGPYLTVDIGDQRGKEIPVHIQYPKWSISNQVALTIPPDATAVDPLVGWEQQYPMLMYGFYFGGTTLTMDWVNMMRVYTPNGPESVSYGDDAFIRYTDPLTGVLYVARDYGKEAYGTQNVNRGIGARMLDYAHSIARATYQYTEGDNGDAVWTRDSFQQPICKLADVNACNAAAQKVRYFSSNLDTLRELADWMGTGPLDRR